MRQLIVDCEASGLHPESYPIQVAWIDVNTKETDVFYIKPHDTWLHWDYNAQDIHNIRREMLVDIGLPLKAAAQRFLDATNDGNCIVYSDAPEFEGFWLGTMFDTANVSPSAGALEVAYVLDLLDTRQKKREMSRIMRNQNRPHDALDDCRMILAAYEQARDKDYELEAEEPKE